MPLCAAGLKTLYPPTIHCSVQTSPGYRQITAADRPGERRVKRGALEGAWRDRASRNPRGSLAEEHIAKLSPMRTSGMGGVQRCGGTAGRDGGDSGEGGARAAGRAMGKERTDGSTNLSALGGHASGADADKTPRRFGSDPANRRAFCR